MTLNDNVLIKLRLSLLATVTAFAGVLSPSAFGFDNCPSALRDSDGDYCGNDRGNYVLRPNGVSLWVTANTDDEAVLMVREPNDFGSLTERILMSYDDVIAGFGPVSGLGSNPHVNSAGQAVWQASAGLETNRNGLLDCVDPDLLDGLGNLASGYYTALFNARVIAGLEDLGDCYGQGLFVSSPGEAPVLVAKSGQDIDYGLKVCEEGVQPWPQIGPNGHYVAGLAVRGESQACGRELYHGDADVEPAVKGFTTAVEAEYPVVARIDRIVAGSYDRTADNPAVEITYYYTPLNGAELTFPQQLRASQAAFIDADDGLAFLNKGSFSVPSLSWSAGPVPDSMTITSTDSIARLCSPDGCDIDTSAWGYYVFNGNTPSLDRYRLGADDGPNALGRRVVVRGRAGGEEPQIMLKSARAPNEAFTSTSFSVPVTNSFVNDAGHPFAVGGVVNHFTRTLDAITHSGRMVGSDGSFVVRSSFQAGPADVYWPSRENGLYRGYSLNRKFQPWSRGVIHVNASGTPTLVANSTNEYRYITGALMTSDNGVLYRAAYSDRDDDLAVPVPLEQQAMVVGFSGAPADNEVPTGANQARPGEWYPKDAALYNTTTNKVISNFNCDGDEQGCSVLVRTDSPSGGADYTARVSRFTEDAADVNDAVTANSLALRVDKKELFQAQILTNLYEAQPDNSEYIYFPLTAANVRDYSEYRLEYPLELRTWNASSGATSVVFANRETSPAGYSKLTGIPKHFSEGGGVTGFRTDLSPPFYGQIGGGGDNTFDPFNPAAPEDTILGAAQPCKQAFEGDDGLYDECHAVYASVNGELTEIARNTRAEFVFRSQDNGADIGVTGVEGFSFHEISATVPVSETGSVFFGATTADDYTTTWGSDVEGACAVDDLEGAEFGNRDGVFLYKNGVVEKIVAEGDVISSGLIEGLVLAIKMPQPELRQAVAGDSIMLKLLLDTDQDCDADTVGLVAATSPSGTPDGEDSFDMTPDKGAFAGAYSTQAGRVQMTAVDDEGNLSPWRITTLEILDPASAEYLTEEEAGGGLLSFNAVYDPQSDETPGAAPEGGYPNLNVVLRLEVDDERVLGLIKDLESKTDLMPTITATEDGATQMTFTVTDNDDSKDLDATDGVIRDPAGISMALAALVPPSVPVPLMGQFFLFLLGGLVSLIGGLRSLRRRAT